MPCFKTRFQITVKASQNNIEGNSKYVKYSSHASFIKLPIFHGPCQHSCIHIHVCVFEASVHTHTYDCPSPTNIVVSSSYIVGLIFHPVVIPQPFHHFAFFRLLIATMFFFFFTHLDNVTKSIFVFRIYFPASLRNN